MERRGGSHVPTDHGLLGEPSALASPARLRAAEALSRTGVFTLAPLCALIACCASGSTAELTDSGAGAGGAGGQQGQGGRAQEEEGDSLFEGGGDGLLAITPSLPTLTIELPLTGQTVQFQCIDPATDLPAADVTWSLDSIALGTIDAEGVYTPNGARGGTVQVTCARGGLKAKTKLHIHLHAFDDMGSLTAQQKAALKGPSGKSDPEWKFLYPYDQTVFPRGILAPEVHLTPGKAPAYAFYMHIEADDYEYEGFFGLAAQSTQLQMSQPAWEALARSANGKKVEVSISKLYNNLKYGPISRTWVLAAGKLHGTIYYNTYNSPLAQETGAMLRIKGTSSEPEVLVGNCTVCHSISSDGSTAAAANHGGIGGTFDLSSGTPNPESLWKEEERAAFAALYPKKGEVLVTNGAPGKGWPPNTPGTKQSWLSELRTRNGTLIPGSGIEKYYAMTPAFSHDGAMLAFNDRSPVQQGQYWPGVLALLRYDAAAQKFSDYQVLAAPPTGRQYAWPAFTPDNRAIIFQDGVGEDLATWNWFGNSGNTGKIYAVDVETKKATSLARLNGDGYMPKGQRDENKNYEPTIAPVASGGYFWVMFTSRRTYGNKLTGGPDETKRLWVAAIDVDPEDGADPSHPAFYIAGQELTSGNSRGFWALDPCKGDGQTCESGDECCNGFCNPTSDPTSFACGPTQGVCSEEFDACQTDGDCCSADLRCIGGRCTKLPPH